MSDLSPTPHYRVIAQEETTEKLPTGNFGPGVRITAQLDSGTTFSVFVPGFLYANHDAVISALRSQAMITAGYDGHQE